jgi:simple sugar transport system permease protein
MSEVVEPEKVVDPRRMNSSPGWMRWARRNAVQLGILLVGAVIWIIFFMFAAGTFGRREIYQAIMSTMPFFAIIALPLTLVVIAKEIDLSFPSIMAFSVTIFAMVLTRTENPWLALVACLISGLLVGLLNGVIVVKVGIPALVATIGTQFLWRGVVLVINGGNGTSLVPVKDTFLYNVLVGRLDLSGR